MVLWYATRATGVVALVLLTATVVLGVAGTARFAAPGLPRVITAGLHRNLSLLVVGFVAVHVLTTVADSYTSIGLSAAVIPFSSDYRRLWLGLGTIAFDLLLAVTLTSLLRDRLSLPGLARGALARLRVLAGRALARPGHRDRQPAALAAGPGRAVRGRRRGGGLVAAVAGRARARPDRRPGRPGRCCRRPPRSSSSSARCSPAGRGGPGRRPRCSARGPRRPRRPGRPAVRPWPPPRARPCATPAGSPARSGRAGSPSPCGPAPPGTAGSRSCCGAGLTAPASRCRAAPCALGRAAGQAAEQGPVTALTGQPAHGGPGRPARAAGQPHADHQRRPRVGPARPAGGVVSLRDAAAREHTIRRLTVGWQHAGRPAGLREHLDVYGPLPTAGAVTRTRGRWWTR